MSGPIPTMSIDKLKVALGAALDDERVRHDPQMLLICLSMAEHLKDAERWHVVKNQEVVFYPGVMPDDVQRIVDHYIKERKK